MKDYCYYCGKDVELEIKEEIIEMSIKGITFSYLAQIAYCKDCKKEVYIGELDDENIERANRKYRDVADFIQIDEIQLLMDKYNIGKKPLAKLLDWGETTIIRYLDGLTPSKEYSSKLKSLLNNPQEMQELLNKNTDKITKLTANKVQAQLDNIFMELYRSKDNETQEALDVARFFLSKVDDESGQEITPLKLQKLVYYAQSWCLSIFNHPLLTKDCQAWVHGPVYPELYFKFKEYKYAPIMYSNNFDESIFSEDQLFILNGVWKVYGKYDAKYLEKMTHKEDPWKISRNGCKECDKSTNVISKDVIKEYYSKIKNQRAIVSFDDLNKYVSNLDIE